MLNAAKDKTDSLSRWAVAVQARLLEGRGSHCGQERAHVLGRADPRRIVQAPGLRIAAMTSKIAAPAHTFLPATAPPQPDPFLPPCD